MDRYMVDIAMDASDKTSEALSALGSLRHWLANEEHDDIPVETKEQFFAALENIERERTALNAIVSCIQTAYEREANSATCERCGEPTRPARIGVLLPDVAHCFDCVSEIARVAAAEGAD